MVSPYNNIHVLCHKTFEKLYNELPEDDKIRQKIKEIRDEMLRGVNNGRYIKNKPYPQKYRQHGIHNLYVCDLPGAHRAIFTILTDEKSRYYQFLDLLDHKQYDVLFGYTTS